MALTYSVSGNFVKAEEMYRLVLDGKEVSLGKDHEETEGYAMGLARFYFVERPDKTKARELIKAYPFLFTDPMTGPHVRSFLSEGDT